MDKAVLISIHPEWCEEIILGKKTMEVRKNRPTLDVPFKAYIYCTKAPKGWLRAVPGHGWQQLDGKVIGEFVCDKIERVDIPYPAYQSELDKRFIEESRVPYYALHRYAFHDDLFFWHISDLKIYDKPRSLHEFCRFDFQSMNGTGICGNTKCENYISSDSWMQPPECAIDWCYLKRPPQSWCYVKDVE